MPREDAGDPDLYRVSLVIFRRPGKGRASSGGDEGVGASEFDYAACWAAGFWQRAFDAETRSLDGDPEQVLSRREAQDRLSLAGLRP